jgi:hypothetical protein
MKSIVQNVHAMFLSELRILMTCFPKCSPPKKKNLFGSWLVGFQSWQGSLVARVESFLISYIYTISVFRSSAFYIKLWQKSESLQYTWSGGNFPCCSTQAVYSHDRLDTGVS